MKITLNDIPGLTSTQTSLSIENHPGIILNPHNLGQLIINHIEAIVALSHPYTPYSALNPHLRSAQCPWSLDDIARIGELCAPHEPGQCWEWQGSQDRLGNPRYGANDDTRYVARILPYLVGRMPTKVVVRSCDNALCMNPEHLR